MRYRYTNNPEAFKNVNYELPPELIDFSEASKALKISIEELLKLLSEDPDFPEVTMLTIPTIKTVDFSGYIRLKKRKEKRQKKAAQKRKGGKHHGR